MKALPTTRAAQLGTPQRDEEMWLIEGLWSAQAVGIIGGEPKCGKSFLALDLAVSVASGTPCLRHFATRQCGPVLLFAAEDAPYTVRQRLEGITAAAGADFHSLDVHVITVPTLRLDLCHGTGGNGYAFLKLYRRTSDPIWVERARQFAMTAIVQYRGAQAVVGRGRYSLWTGDVGLAIYLWDCITGAPRFPTIDVF
jgi:AAA domain/Lanthionine synthetase C-like protein